MTDSLQAMAHGVEPWTETAGMLGKPAKLHFLKVYFLELHRSMVYY